MNNTFNQINSLADLLNQSVNDSIFCSMLDSGIDPGIAWNSVYTGDTPVAITSDVPQVTDHDDFQAVEFATV